jgi:hypothetical protein
VIGGNRSILKDTFTQKSVRVFMREDPAMRATSLIVLSAMLLIPGNPLLAKPCRVCVQPPTRVLLQRGKTTKLTWTITGTTLPVRAHFINRNPGAVDVAGGNDQYVTSSGGTPNVVTRNVTVRSPGVFQVEVSVDELELIPTLYRGELRRIGAETKAAAKALRGRMIPEADVLGVLDRAVEDIETSLPFEELTAFRDAVREYADELRREIATIAVADRFDAGMIQLVAQRSSAEGIPTPKAKLALNQLGDFIFRASEVDPLTEICVVTLPVNGATLLLYPKSAPDQTERTTATRFPIYVGLYSWEIRQRTGYLSSTGTVNFLTDPDRILECTLRRSAGDANACDLVRGNLDQRCRK